MVQEQMSGDIWAISSPGVFFWPLFSIDGEPDEARIHRMMASLRRKG